MTKDNKFMSEALVTSSNKGNMSTDELIRHKTQIEETLVRHKMHICKRKEEALLHEKKVIEKELNKRTK